MTGPRGASAGWAQSYRLCGEEPSPGRLTREPEGEGQAGAIIP